MHKYGKDIKKVMIKCGMKIKLIKEKKYQTNEK